MQSNLTSHPHTQKGKKHQLINMHKTRTVKRVNSYFPKSDHSATLINQSAEGAGGLGIIRSNKDGETE